jgi:hypothetical protein
MADELLTKVEKQMEGTNLALAAVAEVLQKMDARFSYDEEAQIRKEEQDNAVSERSMLIKEIASEVVGILKQGGMDVDGTKVRSAAKTGKSGADDAEKPVNIKSNIADQQATIQAMRKQNEEEEEEDEEEFPVKGGYMKTHVPGHEDDEDEEMEKEGADEYPAEEEEPEIEEEKSMRKQLISLRKQLAGFQNGMDTKIQKEAESRLRKMGFREENGLQRPQLIDRNAPIGTDGTTFIAKAAQQDDVVDQLANLSYKQLRDMQMAIHSGNTEGIPRELLG